MRYLHFSARRINDLATRYGGHPPVKGGVQLFGDGRRLLRMELGHNGRKLTIVGVSLGVADGAMSVLDTAINSNDADLSTFRVQSLECCDRKAQA
jgi:hypothetical protein